MSISSNLLLLDHASVQALLTHAEALSCVKRAYVAHSSKQGRIFPLVREGLPANAVFGIKSGDIASDQVLGLKAAGFWPGNVALGKDSHQGTILLVSPATGRPLALMDGNHITAMRTGAAGAVGIELLARPNSSHVCVFGTGVQAQIQVDFALRFQPELRRLTYLTISGEPDAAFEQKFQGRCSVAHQVNADAAVSQADIVITATPSRKALFSSEAVRPGTHINAVGADTKGKRELPAGLLEKAMVVVDDVVQAKSVGECQWALDSAVTEIGALLAHPSSQPFVRTADAISVFDMTGIALQDLTVAHSLVQAAQRDSSQKHGQQIAWAW
jgi:ornithine cyclodeaminase/alanine dehydrogenase-like protein (mu-crystallin family)